MANLVVSKVPNSDGSHIIVEDDEFKITASAGVILECVYKLTNEKVSSKYAGELANKAKTMSTLLFLYK